MIQGVDVDGDGRYLLDLIRLNREKIRQILGVSGEAHGFEPEEPTPCSSEPELLTDPNPYAGPRRRRWRDLR